MSGKTGRKPTGRKPSTVRRQDAKTNGAFGKEQLDQVTPGDAARNIDKSVKRRIASR
jgi:hypothetical protein